MWKAPKRPNENDITENFNDGVLTVYAVENVAQAGYKPVEKLTKRIVLRYQERRVGLSRYYASRQNQVQIERVVRVPRAGNVSNQDVAITEDGCQYRIDLVQSVLDAFPECMDISLAKIEQEYEVKG